jgi:hypothetical protein
MIHKRAWSCFAVWLLICVSAGIAWGAPLVVTPSSNATTLVNALLAPVSGVTVVAGSQVYTGASAASGLFTGGTGIIPFDSGVVLTTGQANFIMGPNTAPDTSNDNGAGGDAALTTIAGNDTFNASILEFSFIPTNNTISFQFVFGSEEYNEFVDTQFNDVFAFFLNGANIALIPGTSTPITVNTVNNNVNSQFYTDNTGGALNTELDGLVGVKMALFAVGSVNPGVANTIRLAIADTSDESYDSAVMIRGGSFMNEPPPDNGGVIPEPSTWLLLGGGLVLIGATKRFRRI